MGVKGIRVLVLIGRQENPLVSTRYCATKHFAAVMYWGRWHSRFVLVDNFGDKIARRPVSRVLSDPAPVGAGPGRPFLWDAHRCAPHATNPGGGAGTPLRRASGFHRPRRRPPLFGLAPGGLFSVALSLGSPPPAVSRHRVPVEPGLSSTLARAPGWRRGQGSGRPAVWQRKECAPVPAGSSHGGENGVQPGLGRRVGMAGDGVRQPVPLERAQGRRGVPIVIADGAERARHVAHQAKLRRWSRP